MLQITEDLETTLKEARGPRIERDEKDVIKVAEQVENWGNPFEQSEELSSLSSGRIATKEISDDLLSAKKTREEATMTFMKERVISNNEDFFSPITKLKSKTFADLSKKTTIKLQNKEEILKADRTLFARMAVVAQSREMDMRDVLKHSYGPLPWSLAAVDGSYAKTTKSKLAELIEKGIDVLEGEPELQYGFWMQWLSYKPLQTFLRHLQISQIKFLVWSCTWDQMQFELILSPIGIPKSQ